MATLGSLVISLEASTAKFEAAMTKAEYTAKKASDNIVGALKVVGVAAAGMFSLSAMDAAVTRITTMESNLVKAAARLNTTAETLSSFSIIARKAGMDNDSFILTLSRMEKGMSAAALSTEQATGKYDENGDEILKTSKTYDELGLNVRALIKLPLDQQLMAIAKAMKENIAPADRVRVAMELGGKGAAGMVTPFMEGGEAMQKMIDRAKELLPMTEEMAKKGAAVKTATSDMSLAWEGFAAVLVDKVGPSITTILNKLTDMLVAARKAQKLDPVNILKEIHEGHVATGGTGEGVSGGGGGGYGEDVEKPPIRPPGKTGGKGGGGSDGTDRMTTIIDNLRKDLAKLTEGSLAEIKEWAAKMRNEIEKVGQKGAATSEAMGFVDKVEKGKMVKAEEDYALFVAKESGDVYRVIEGQARAWAEKYKGFKTSEVEIAKIAARMKQEEDRKIETDRDNLLKAYYEGMISITRELQHQYAWKQKLLALEIKMSHQQLDDYIKGKGKGLSPDMADDMKKINSLTNATKKYRLEWESIQETAAIYSQALGTIASGFMSVITGIASGTMTVTQGIVSLLESVQSAILNMIMTIVMKWAEAQIVQMMMSSVTATAEVGNSAAIAGAKAYSAYAGIPFIGIILGAAAAALVMGAIFALKSGIKSSAGGDYQVGGAGLRTVHQDETILPAWAANSWRDIVSRGAMPGGGENGTTVHAPITVTIHPRQEMTQGDYDRHSRMIVKSLNRELGRHGKAPLGPSYG